MRQNRVIVAGMRDATVLFNRFRLRVPRDGDVENEINLSDRARLEMESDIKMESARMARY
jgi:hypothetical protein